MSEELELITSVVIVLVCAIVVLFVGKKLRLPLIIGYVITGVVVGPFGLGLIESDQVASLAEIGLILLMFTLGLEISLKTLRELKRIYIFIGILQMGLITISVWTILHFVVHLPDSTAILLGLLAATSSTAIVLSIYQKSGDAEKPHGKLALSLLLLQTLAIIPILLFFPTIVSLLNDNGIDMLVSLQKFAVGLVVFAIILIGAIYLVPILLKKIASVRSSEILILSVVVICFGITGLVTFFGLSMALGAFLAGIAISESDYCHEIIGHILPIRDLFISFFFVSVGMMLDLSFFFRNFPFLIVLTIAVLVLKMFITSLSLRFIAGTARNTAILTGIGLSQIGELGFPMALQGYTLGVLPLQTFQYALGTIFLSMAITPFMIKFAPIIAFKFHRIEGKPDTGLKLETLPGDGKIPHVIIVGFGLAGTYVASALKKVNIPYIILEMNPETVLREKNNGEPIRYGDATNEGVLTQADIKNAQAIVISIPNTDSVKSIVALARKMNPKLGIITRSRFISETAELYKLGADEVIVDEREAAIKVYKRILSNEQIPLQDIDEFAKKLRSDMYDKYIETPINSNIKRAERTGFLSGLMLKVQHSQNMDAADTSYVEQIHVDKKSAAVGKKLGDISMRSDYGVSVVAVRKAGIEEVVSPDNNMDIGAGDVIIVIGERDLVHKMVQDVFAVKNTPAA